MMIGLNFQGWEPGCAPFSTAKFTNFHLTRKSLKCKSKFLKLLTRLYTVVYAGAL